ncbi:hypothetical protein H0H92_005804, partial [Tricholoma furcatifolium]
MAQSTEERRNNHNAACQRYRDRNLDKIRTSARERMRRARRKDNVENMSSTAITNFTALPQDVDRAYHRRCTPGGSGPTLNAQEVERAVKAALECDRSQDFWSESHLHHAHHMQVLMAMLPPSSEPEYSDSDSSDIHTLPVVTDSSAEEDGCWISDSSETSSDEEREVVLLLTALSDARATQSGSRFWFYHTMSSPRLSPQPFSESSESTQVTMWRFIPHAADIEVLDAIERLAAAQKAVQAAEAFRSKVLATRARKRGGGPASKQQATAAYESALRRLEDCQAELATLTQKNTVQPTLDKNPPATIGDEAMDVDDNEGRQLDMSAAMMVDANSTHAEDDGMASAFDPDAKDDGMSTHNHDAEDDGEASTHDHVKDDGADGEAQDDGVAEVDGEAGEDGVDGVDGEAGEDG